MSDEPSPVPLANPLLALLFRGYEPAPPRFIAQQTYYPWLVVGLTCVSAFIGQLDASIVQLALPTLEREFDAPLGSVSWVAVAYLVAFAAILPTFGRLAEIVGRKLLYVAGFVLFTVASLLCGLASSLAMLILFRAIQGIGGALLGANSIAVLVKAAGPDRRSRAMGIFAGAQAVGVSLGPAVGGVLLDTLGWRWVFWVNVPIGVAAAMVGLLVLPQTTGLDGKRKFDLPGALLLTPALIGLAIGLTEVHAWGIFSPAIILCLMVSAVLLPVFVWHENKTKAPLLDPALFQFPGFRYGALAVFLSYALLYGIFLLMSFALVRGYRESAVVAGLRLAIIPIALGLVAPISGALNERLGSRILTALGMVVCLVSLILLDGFLRQTTGGLSMVMVALALFGAGLGLFIAPNNDATVHSVPVERSGQAGALINLMRILGTATGVSACSTVFTWRLDQLGFAGGRTTLAPAPVMVAAASDGLLLLIAFAVLAGVAASASRRMKK